MQLKSLSLDEELRLQDLYAYDILDSAVEQEFEDILEIAAQVLGCPISAVTFIDRSRQWLKAKKGTVVDEVPRDIAFCSHTIRENQVFDGYRRREG